MAEKWTHDHLPYFDGNEWHQHIENASGLPICEIDAFTKEECLRRADLICAAPGQAVRIAELERKLADMRAALDKAYTPRGAPTHHTD